MKFALYTVIVLSLFQCTINDSLPSGDPDNGGLFLPDGFEALVVADSIGPARHIAVNDNGDIYVKLRRHKDGKYGNVALRDMDGDGRADSIAYFGIYPSRGSLANGMTIHNGFLYFSSETILYRTKLSPGRLIPDTMMEVVITDDHEHGNHWHITKPVSFDNNGKLYVPFGSPSNACQDMAYSPGGVPGVSGLDPCPELEQHGGIWQFDANTIDLTQKDGYKYATGIRSVVAMDWNAEDEQLYVVMHGRDNLHMLFPNVYSRWESAVLPAEEFLKVTEGADFGWPYCYYDQLQQKKVLAPEYGGNGEIIGRCDTMNLPLMGFPGHWAPNDLRFYRGDQFPEHYKSGAFIAFHGSTNRTPYPQAGYFVAFVPFEKGTPTGDWEVFADGFAQIDPIVSTGNAKYRPMGIALGPDGSLYITDSRIGRIWRILYKGDKSSFGKAQLAQMEKRKQASNIRTPHEVEDNLQKDLTAGGERLYNTYCGSCHQRDGKGAPGRFPPLTTTDWVSGSKDRLIHLVLKGMQGEIEVNSEKYNNVMPPHGFLSNEEVASILSYIRQNFGNKADEIQAEEVKEIRAKINVTLQPGK